MKRFVLVLASFVAFGLPNFAQKKKTSTSKKSSTPAVNLPSITLDEAMKQYRFDDAEIILTNEINVLRNKKLDITEAEDRLRNVQRAKSRMRATEQVSFIDSIIVPKQAILSCINLSEEVGSINTYANTFQKADTMFCTVYKSQMGDHLVSAEPIGSTSLLFSTRKNGDEWGTPVQLNSQGLDRHGDKQQNYPFMLNDGATLYYAAKGDESIGGYDIFMTRYDAEEKTYLAPENIGMPFNSPANDYLFVIDEFNNLGWFVTDRNTSADSVCIYTFIPNESRKIYDSEAIGSEKLRMLARLNSIRDTWSDQQAVNAALQRLADARQSNTISANKTESAFTFVVDDNHICTSFEHFTRPASRVLAQEWQQNKSKVRELETTLENLRVQYTNTSADKASIIKEILSQEDKLRQLYLQIEKQEKEIRRLEHASF